MRYRQYISFTGHHCACYLQNKTAPNGQIVNRNVGNFLVTKNQGINYSPDDA